MQHDERLLPRMLDTLKQGDTDIVVGSRYAAGGDIGDWDARRARMSRLAVRLSRLVVPGDLTDPMSGFFMMRRSVLHGTVHRLSAIGFKILADLFASHREPLRFKELAYRFRVRQAGESKLDSVTAWDYAMLLLDKLVGRWIPVRFLAFSIVGAVGSPCISRCSRWSSRACSSSFVAGQAVATLCAMTFNYTVNNVLTYRDLRLRGARWLRGWVSFVLACSIGGFANLGVASAVYGLGRGWFPAAIAGILDRGGLELRGHHDVDLGPRAQVIASPAQPEARVAGIGSSAAADFCDDPVCAAVPASSRDSTRATRKPGFWSVNSSVLPCNLATACARLKPRPTPGVPRLASPR